MTQFRGRQTFRSHEGVRGGSWRSEKVERWRRFVQQTRQTIHDIARQAGVSAKTVSRVLNDKSGVSPATRDRVRRLIEELRYHPHMGAQSLRGARRGCVGVTFAAPLDEVPLSQEFFLWLFGHLYRLFGAKGERLCVDQNPRNSHLCADYGRSVWDKLFSTCVVVGPLPLGDETIRRIHATGIPYVALGRLDDFPECNYATADYEEGARMATSFLVSRGHKRIALLQALSKYQPGLDRLRGYRRALEEAGLPFDERLVRPVSFDLQDIADQAYRLLADGSATGLVDASGTESAEGLRHAARRAGMTTGSDFEVVVWTYEDQVAILPEASAHIWLPVREAAAEGLELLAAWHTGQQQGPIHVLYPPTLFTEMPVIDGPVPRRLFFTLA